MFKHVGVVKQSVFLSLAIGLACLGYFDYNGYIFNSGYTSLMAITGFVFPIIGCFFESINKDFRPTSIFLTVLAFYTLIRQYTDILNPVTKSIVVMSDGATTTASATTTVASTMASTKKHREHKIESLFMIPSTILLLCTIPLLIFAAMRREYIDAIIVGLGLILLIIFIVALSKFSSSVNQALGVFEFIMAFALIAASIVSLYLDGRRSCETVEEVEVTNTYTSEVPKTIVV